MVLEGHRPERLRGRAGGLVAAHFVEERDGDPLEHVHRRPAPESGRWTEGLWIEGTDASIFVSRSELKDLKGTVIAEFADKIPEEDLIKLCKGKKPGNHMGNFIECVRDRSTPISDVVTHHRALTTCHLANIAIRLNRQ